MADSGPPMGPPPGTGQPDHNRGPEILAVCCSLVAVSSIFVAMRFYVRIRMTKNVAWDDWTVLASWVRRDKFVNASAANIPFSVRR
jgi:hypothetical protein